MTEGSWTLGWVEELSYLGRVHALLFGVGLPLFALRLWWKYRRTGLPPVDRLRFQRRAVITLCVLGSFSWWTARDQGLDLLPARLPSLGAWMRALALYVVAVLVMLPKWRLVTRLDPGQVQRFLSETRMERATWLALSLAAGIGEELSWRGVQPVLLQHVFGSEAGGVYASLLAFGLAHATQGMGSVYLVTLLALGFHGLVQSSGSLYTAMAVHMLCDLTAGVALTFFARRTG